jgi:hypothetical protein
VGVATRLLAKTPEERYPDAAAVRRDFVAVRAALPPGPTLSQWLTEVSAALLAPRVDGDFGVAGPPAPVPLPGAPAARPAIATKAEFKPPPPRPLVPPTAGSPPRLLIALGLVIAGLLGALVVAVVLPIVTPPPVVSAEGHRADLLAPDEASLLLLTNSTLVKHAARYVDQGKPLHLEETEGTVTAASPTAQSPAWPRASSSSTPTAPVTRRASAYTEWWRCWRIRAPSKDTPSRRRPCDAARATAPGGEVPVRRTDGPQRLANPRSRSPRATAGTPLHRQRPPRG